MVAESYKYVVLGGGNAGGYAAREVTRSIPTGHAAPLRANAPARHILL